MLRLTFVLGLVAMGAWFSLRGPFSALLFYVWNAYFRPESWVGSGQEALIQSLRISYCVGIYVVAASLFTRQRFVFNLHTALISLFALQCVLSTVVSEHTEYAWGYLAEFLKALTITYLIVVLASARVRLRQLILVMALSLGFEGAKQGWVGLLLHPGSLNTNTIPFLGDNNVVALGMLMLVPFFDALAQTTTRKWPKYLYRFLLIGVLYRALTTYSRGGFLSSGALAVIYWVRSRTKVRLLVGMAVVSAIVLSAMPDAFWERMGTISTYEEVGDTSAISRIHFWKTATDMAAIHPIFGVGFNSFEESYDDFDSSHGQYGARRSVHSAWFGVLGELGYPGLGLYVAVLWLAFRNCERARKLAALRPDFTDLRTFSIALETSLSVFVVGGSFLPFQYNELLWHMIGLSQALILVATRQGPSLRARAPEGSEAT